MAVQKIALEPIDGRQIKCRQIEDKPIDGRTKRTTATRRAILDTTRSLLVQGADQPTAREIASAAGITTRTLFRHFDDMETLFATLVKDAQMSIAAVMDEPFATQADWRACLNQIVERRVRVYELLLPLYVSSAWLRGLTDENQRYAIKRGRQRLLEVLPEKITADTSLFEALDATLSIEVWYRLRLAQNLNVQHAKQALQRAVHQLAHTT